MDQLPRVSLDRLRNGNLDACQQICETIQVHSFAIVQFNDSDVELIQKAADMAMKFFCNTSVEDKRHTTYLFDEVENNKVFDLIYKLTLVRDWLDTQLLLPPKKSIGLDVTQKITSSCGLNYLPFSVFWQKHFGCLTEW
jgi:hypothetical protein